MSSPQPPHSPGEVEPDVERTLAETLRAERLPAAGLSRVRAAVETEWRALSHRDRRGLRGGKAAAWAAVVVTIGVVSTVLAWWRPANQGAIVGELVRVDAGGIEVRLAPLHHRSLRVGDPIRVGDELEVHGSSLVALGRNGSLRVAGGSLLMASDAKAVKLERGRIYVDLPPGDPANSRFRVVTRAGAVEHLGTEFEVMSDERIVRLRVREGEIRWLLAGAPALATAGTQLSVSPGGGLARTEVPTDGPDWAWAEALAPDYRIEGRSLADFLEKIGRELGCRVEFADAHAQEVAAHTVLHGSVRVSEPLSALETVIATTSLTYEIQAATIRVHSGP
jgi:ferric-dicitrate binding protein FerR (iron transport regulator)